MGTKLEKKLHRSLALLKRHEPDLVLSQSATNTLYVGNSGVVCGVSWEELSDTFSQFGAIEHIFAYQGPKPYTFVVFETVDSAVAAMHHLQGKHPETVAKPGVVFYLAYVERVPRAVQPSPAPLPLGLHMIENFVSAEEEERLWARIRQLAPATDLSEGTSLKHRRVYHFGYEFVYGNNSVNLEGPFPEPLDELCLTLIDRMCNSGLIECRPDQLTVNVYEPGQGIPTHLDTHSAFEDAIISLSLLSNIVMDFRHPNDFKNSVPVFLPARSLAVMTGESRYVWKHGISPRKFDLLSSGRLQRRQLRCSFTFRSVRRSACKCAFAQFCDWDRSSELPEDDILARLPQTDSDGRMLEQKYVCDVYNAIAPHFDCTRHSRWRGIEEFMSQLPPGSLLLDVGCGNGKYLVPSDQLVKVGCDLSVSLCEISSQKGCMVAAADALNIAFDDGRFDAALSIAVIHHFSTQERRRRAVMELLRVLRPGGRALITVWAFEQKHNDDTSEYLKWGKSRNVQNNSNKTGSLPVHVNLTEFKQQDLLVPWNMNKRWNRTNSDDKNDSNERFLRYYHVFREGELESLVKSVDFCELISCYYEQGNWCAILQKCA